MNCQNNPCTVPVGKLYAALSGTGDTGDGKINNGPVLGRNFANLVADKERIEIVSPADNKYGLIIRTCSAYAPKHGFALHLLADTVLPEVYGGNYRVAWIATAPPVDNLNYPLYVQPGNGLWFFTNELGYMNITYDLLDENGGCSTCSCGNAA